MVKIPQGMDSAKFGLAISYAKPNLSYFMIRLEYVKSRLGYVKPRLGLEKKNKTVECKFKIGLNYNMTRLC